MLQVMESSVNTNGVESSAIIVTHAAKGQDVHVSFDTASYAAVTKKPRIEWTGPTNYGKTRGIRQCKSNVENIYLLPDGPPYAWNLSLAFLCHL